MGDHWQGGAVRSVDFHRGQRQPGHAWAWLRPRIPLVQGGADRPDRPAAGHGRLRERPHPAAGADGGRVPERRSHLPLFAAPEGDWIGFDTTVSIGPTGLGLTETVLHERGPVGTVQQILTVRPMRRIELTRPTRLRHVTGGGPIRDGL
jgi:hypothetical protein